jgi:hypothetical protein
MSTSHDLTMHYAGSTGALKVAVSHVEMMLRMALKTQRTEAGLRREVVELLGYVERENVDQRARDREAGTAIEHHEQPVAAE